MCPVDLELGYIIIIAVNRNPSIQITSTHRRHGHKPALRAVGVAKCFRPPSFRCSGQVTENSHHHTRLIPDVLKCTHHVVLIAIDMAHCQPADSTSDAVYTRINSPRAHSFAYPRAFRLNTYSRPV